MRPSHPRQTHDPSAHSSFLALLVAGWLPFFLAFAEIIRLQAAFDAPTRTVEFLPGWSVFAGRASEYAANWLLLLSLSGTGALASWGLLLECLGSRRIAVWPRIRWRVLAGPIAAWALLAIWAMSLDNRHLGTDFWPVAIFLHAPTILVSYAIVGSGLRSVPSLRLCALILVALWMVTAAAQLHFERPGQSDPEQWIILGGSLPLAVAVALRLGIWGFTDPLQTRPFAS